MARAKEREEGKAAGKKPSRRRKAKTVEPSSRGLSPNQVSSGTGS